MTVNAFTRACARWRVGSIPLFLVVLCISAVVRGQTPDAAVGAVLPPWTPGTLDIHQIATGKGNAAFMIFPDGTTLLFDAGDAADVPYADPKPDASRTPGQWIARYITHMLAGRPHQLDYAVISHFHPDHMGRSLPADPTSARGTYRLRGVTEVAETLPIGTLIDRGDAYLPAPNDAMLSNYKAFVAANPTMTRRTAIAGSRADIRERQATDGFGVRTVAVNDRVWTGQDETSVVRFPALDAIAVPEDRPTENMCSVAIRITYGAFDFFTGGDMPGYPTPGGPAWHDLESAVAKAIGPTDVQVTNHHGSIEVMNPTWLAATRPQVMILPAWQPTHPSPDVLKRMLSTRLYPGPRQIFITEFREPTKATIGARAAQVASDHGHVVVRVAPGGATFQVFVLDDQSESFRITKAMSFQSK